MISAVRAAAVALTAAAGLAAAPAAAEDGAAAFDRAGWPDSFTLGAASQGGTYFTYGSGWAGLVSRALGISGGVEVTGGPTQNLALVQSGDLAFGMTTLGPAQDALEGRSPIAPGFRMDKIRAMFPMYETVFSIIVLESSGVAAIADIPDGARIGVGPAGGTADTYFPAMLESLGVSFEKRNGGYADLSGQLRDGLVDVLAFSAGLPVPVVSQLEAQTEITVIGFTEAEQARLLETFPVAAATVPAGTYRSLTADARAVSMWNVAIANADAPESLIYAVVKTVMESNAEMTAIHQAAAATLPANAAKNTVLPWHPGAARWFEENGHALAPIE
ncbi:MAG: TAXI family TRAP transporter solute-binding subunit [Pseudomonadota bacterium]